MNWNTVCTPKKGGLGIRPLRQMNNALLGKLLWRIGEDTNSLWRSVILAKYGLRRDGWDLDGPYTRTQAYGISNKEAFLNSIKYRVGSNSKILLWQDTWAGDWPLAA